MLIKLTSIQLINRYYTNPEIILLNLIVSCRIISQKWYLRYKGIYTIIYPFLSFIQRHYMLTNLRIKIESFYFSFTYCYFALIFQQDISRPYVKNTPVFIKFYNIYPQQGPAVYDLMSNRIRQSKFYFNRIGVCEAR